MLGLRPTSVAIGTCGEVVTDFRVWPWCSFPIFGNGSFSSPKGLKGLRIDDLELIASYKKTKNPELVAQLMEKYSAQILAFGMRSLKGQDDVKDFTHDVYLKLCDKLYTEDIENFKSWLVRFMKNLFFDKKRKEQVHKNHIARLSNEEHYSIEKELWLKMDRGQVYKAIDRLGEREKKCITILYLEGKNYKEMMTETGWTFNQIKGVRERAAVKLRKFLGPEFKEINN